MKEIKTPCGWVIKSPPTMTKLGKYAFIMSKGNSQSYIEKRSEGWCCYKEFEQYAHSCANGIQLSIKGKPFKSMSLDDVIIHAGALRKEKDEIMLYYIKDFRGE